MKLLSDEFKRNRKTALITRLSVLGALLLLMVIFTFFDLEASEALYHNGNAFGKVFSHIFFAVGYVPAILVDSVLFACAFYMVKNKGLKVLFAFLTYATIAGALYTVFGSFDNVPDAAVYGVMGGGGLVVAAACLYFFKKLNADTLKKLFYLFLIGAIMATLAILVIAPLQQFWGRTRFYALIDGQGEYTKWLFPQGVDKSQELLTRGFRSFPSMHASSTASMIMLILIAWKFEFKKTGKIIMYAAAAFVIVCVCFSRVVMGWHYMTDVIFGLIVPFLCLEAAILITDKMYRKKNLAASPASASPAVSGDE